MTGGRSEDYCIWEAGDVDNILVPYNLEGIEDVEQKASLIRGRPFDVSLPAGLRFTANPDYPDDLVLADYHGNTENVFPISPKLKEYLEARELPYLQFVPVDMLDHRGNVLAEYFLLHVTEVIDCIDLGASDVLESAMDQNMLLGVDELVLDQAKIPLDKPIFKLDRLFQIAISRKLAEEIDSQGFTGIHWEEIDEYSY